jgi:hypothetical protein
VVVVVSGNAKVPSDLGRSGISKTLIVHLGRALSRCRLPVHLRRLWWQVAAVAWLLTPARVCSLI